MKNYSVKLDETGGYSWATFEHQTEQVVERFYFEEDAKKFTKTLNKGRAFDGWTPAFFLNTQHLAVLEKANVASNS